MQTCFIYDCTPRFVQFCALSESRYTGKERDTESGLDYFGARYYASTMGRFMSPDPSRLSVDFQDPQTWNRYTYVLNRPLTMIDRNGKWPTEIHNEIIDNAFPNLSNRQRQILKDISAKQDSVTSGGQGTDVAYEHAMRNANQTVAEAKALYDNYVANQGDIAQDAQMDWYLQEPDWPALSDEALGDFGKALHAVLDSTSPAHEGFQVWKHWLHFGRDMDHKGREATITPMQMRSAVAAARSQFNDVFNRFGFQAFQDQPVYVVTSRIIY
jgi:RHS repeat-associated protein